jgi:hypothetical protein
VARALHGPQSQSYILIIPYLINQSQLNTGFNFANLDMCATLPLGYQSVWLLSIGDLKRKLKGEEFDTMEELQVRVEELQRVPPGHEHLNIGRTKLHFSMTFI